MTWAVTPTDTGVHVTPDGDHTAHPLHLDCPCGPDPEWADPDDGVTYPNGPLVVHHSLDGREHREP